MPVIKPSLAALRPQGSPSPRLPMVFSRNARAATSIIGSAARPGRSIIRSLTGAGSSPSAFNVAPPVFVASKQPPPVPPKSQHAKDWMTQQRQHESAGGDLTTKLARFAKVVEPAPITKPVRPAPAPPSPPAATLAAPIRPVRPAPPPPPAASLAAPIRPVRPPPPPPPRRAEPPPLPPLARELLDNLEKHGVRLDQPPAPPPRRTGPPPLPPLAKELLDSLERHGIRLEQPFTPPAPPPPGTQSPYLSGRTERLASIPEEDE